MAIIDKVIESGANDGERWTGIDPGFSNSYATGYLGYDEDFESEEHGFFCWIGITMEGARIKEAYLKLYCTNLYGSPELRIYGVDEQNPAVPTTGEEFDADPLTAAYVVWNSGFVEDEWCQSPSLVSVIQELVDSHAFINSNLMLQIRGQIKSGTHDVYVAMYEYDPEWRPQLHIEYTTADFWIDLDESIVLTDTLFGHGGWTFFQNLIDSVSVSDALEKCQRHILSEILYIWDVISRKRSVILLESLSLSDFISTVKCFGKTLAESIGLSDEIIKNAHKAVVDGLLLLDTVHKRAHLALSDAISLSDSMSTIHTWARSLVESINLSSAINKGLTRALPESLSLSGVLVLTKNRLLDLLMAKDSPLSVDSSRVPILAITSSITTTLSLTTSVGGGRFVQ